jgi:hypothetical protein
MSTVASRSPAGRSRWPGLLAGSAALLALACSGSIAERENPGNPGDPPGTRPGTKPTTPGTNPGTTPPGTPTNPGTTPPTGGNPPSTPTGPTILPPSSLPGADYKGPRPLRRLTRTQYNNTVRDLLGVTGDFGASIGIDEGDGGFASNNEAPLTEVQIGSYQQVAEELAGKAVVNVAALVPCAPPKAAEADCIDQFVRGFGKRAYRRPLSDVEVSRYKQLFTSGRAGGDFAAGISLVVSAMLQSPHFLYLVETGDSAAAVGGRQALTPYEVGTRLSYFLINSTPDDELLAAADSGKLKAPAEIAAQATRLLGSLKARDTMVAFFEQWLEIDDLLTVEKDAKAYPMYTPEVRAAMRDELLEFTDNVARTGDSRLATLLTAKFTFLRGPAYPIYGFPMQPNAGGSILHRVDLPAAERAGVFTRAGVLAKHGHADQSSPVGRGLMISDRLLCITPPPPPPGVDNNVPPVDPNVPTRLRFEKHRTKPECASCHALMDPLGVPFEIYDGIGRYRTTDGGKPVDPASMLTGTKNSNGPIKDALDLMTKLSTADETRACVTRQMFRYAFGRMETSDDEATITEALAAFAKNDYKITDLMVALATTPGFRTRKAPELQ